MTSNDTNLETKKEFVNSVKKMDNKIDLPYYDIDGLKKIDLKNEEFIKLLYDARHTGIMSGSLMYLNMTNDDCTQIKPYFNEECLKSLKSIDKFPKQCFNNRLTIIFKNIKNPKSKWNLQNDFTEFQNEKVKIQYYDAIKDYLTKKQYNRFIIFFVSIHYTEKDSHAAALFIDTKLKKVEYFDPDYKKIKFNTEQKYIDDIIRKFLIDCGFKTYDYLPYEEKFNDIIKNDKYAGVFIRDNLGIQSTEGVLNMYGKTTILGLCQFWTLFYINLRIINPDKNITEIFKFLVNEVNNDPETLFKYLLYFSANLEKDTNEFFKKLEKDSH